MGRLKIEAQRLLSLSIAPNTHKAYGTAWVSYENMCREMGRVALLPVSKINIIDFISYLSIQGKSAATISSYISGVSYFHKCQGFDDPADCFVVRKMIEGCRRDNPTLPDTRKPLTLEMLDAVLVALPRVCNSLYETCVFTVALLLAFLE